MRSKRKNLEIHQETQDSTYEVVNIETMGDQEEKRNEVPNNDRQINPRRRDRSSPLNLRGEQHQLPTLPQGIFPMFSQVMGSWIPKIIWINSLPSVTFI
jgi:hypothetical protein